MEAGDGSVTETRVHRTGTPASGHIMTLHDLRDFLNDIIGVHEPYSELPDAAIEFPSGFWITYASPDEETITL